jgi:hypothetical protein
VGDVSHQFAKLWPCLVGDSSLPGNLTPGGTAASTSFGLGLTVFGVADDGEYSFDGIDLEGEAVEKSVEGCLELVGEVLE